LFVRPPKNEDGLDKSKAGQFKTILNVPRDNRGKIIDALTQVMESYDVKYEDNEILIQPMLLDIKLSGVVVTADTVTLAPYYIINYDEDNQSGGVTSGSSKYSKTYIYYKKSPFLPDDPHILKLCNVCKDLENLFNYPFLDIEFAFDKNDIAYIFQIRPLVVRNKEDLSSIDLQESLAKIYNKIKRLSFPYPNLLGKRSMFGVMPDWNPAEMIGLRPKQLALSLYKELITDNIWAYQRDNYGYRNLRSHPLLIALLGVPYIDVRIDFNSFIPKSLDETISEKLVDYYLNKLNATPTHHDKVEFEVVHSCYYLNLPDKLKELQNHGFSEDEIEQIEFSLLGLTNDIIDPVQGLYKKDIQKIGMLNARYDILINSDIPVIEKIYWLVENCKRYGTLPFAGIARAAFIATQFLKSFVDLEIITQDDINRFMNSLNTVTKKFSTDMCKLANGVISKNNFLSEYGHLRPGTYDILSLRYDENFENYFLNIKKESCKMTSFSFRRGQLKKINVALAKEGIKTDAHKLIWFLREAIEGREYAKFVFTKSLSQILKLIETLGNDFGISREDLAYVDIRTVLNLYSVLDHKDMKLVFNSDIERNKETYEYTKAVKLPILIREPKDVYGFFVGAEEPSFITLKRVEGYVITEEDFKIKGLENKIIFIKSADPGYDFLFTNNIAGLVTQFGGMNSHMAIRCAELGIPAVIGVGEIKFCEWLKAKILAIDCANKQVRVVL